MRYFRHDLQDDGAARGHVPQAAQLSDHDLGAAHLTVQSGLVDHSRRAGGFGLNLAPGRAGLARGADFRARG
jgi:hypothetical protein